MYENPYQDKRLKRPSYICRRLSRNHNRNRIKYCTYRCTGRQKAVYIYIIINVLYRFVPCKIYNIVCVCTLVPMKSICYTIEKKGPLMFTFCGLPVALAILPENPFRRWHTRWRRYKAFRGLDQKQQYAKDRISRDRERSPAVYYIAVYSRLIAQKKKKKRFHI